MRKWFTRKWVLFLGLGLALVIGGWWMSNRSKASEQYKVIIPQIKSLQDVLSVSGKVDATHKAVLKYSSAGKLRYMGVEEGQMVKKGQLLANLDAGLLQSAVTEAYYRYLAADANAKEVEDSVKGHDSDETFVQKNDRVTAQTARDIAYDNWLEAKKNLADAYLYAPFAGVVTEITVNTVGANVGVTDGITIVDPASLYFAVEVDETDLGKIALGQAVTIDLDAFETDIVGKIASIGYATQLSDSGATVLPVKVTLADEDLANLKLGLNGDAEIVVQTLDQALVVPIDAVKGDKVTLADGTEVEVELGIVTDSEIEIKSGLRPDQQIRLAL